MPKYLVIIPTTGRLTIEVEAENEKAAKDAAFEAFDPDKHEHEWEMHNRIVSGNCFHGMQNEIDVEEIDD